MTHVLAAGFHHCKDPMPTPVVLSLALSTEDARLRFNGDAGRTYRLQRATDPSGPWSTFANLTGVLKSFDAVGREDEVEVKRAILELDEILAAFDFGGLRVGQGESEFPQRWHQGRAILRGLFDEQVGVLGGVRETKQDGAGLAEEKKADTAPLEAVPDFLRLAVFKRGHIPASPAGSPRTTCGNPRLCQNARNGASSSTGL